MLFNLPPAPINPAPRPPMSFNLPLAPINPAPRPPNTPAASGYQMPKGQNGYFGAMPQYDMGTYGQTPPSRADDPNLPPGINIPGYYGNPGQLPPMPADQKPPPPQAPTPPPQAPTPPPQAPQAPVNMGGGEDQYARGGPGRGIPTRRTPPKYARSGPVNGIPPRMAPPQPPMPQSPMPPPPGQPMALQPPQRAASMGFGNSQGTPGSGGKNVPSPGQPQPGQPIQSIKPLSGRGDALRR